MACFGSRSPLCQCQLDALSGSWAGDGQAARFAVTDDGSRWVGAAAAYTYRWVLPIVPMKAETVERTSSVRRKGRL